MVWKQDDIMAEDPHIHSQLFFELKKRFPEVPDNVVSTLMRDNNFIRERCIDALGRESNKYLYSPPDNLGLDNLHINHERHLSSNSGSSEGLCKRSDSAESRHSLGSTSSSTVPGRRNSSQANNGLGSANTTPISDIDVQTLCAQMYVASQNGPFSPRPLPYYPPQSGQAYQLGPGTPGRQGQYPPHSQPSGPSSMPQGHFPEYHPNWAYDRQHQTPPSTQRFQPPTPGAIRTPSPQHYPMYPFEYPQTVYNPSGSPNTGRPVFYTPPGTSMDPQPRASQVSYPTTLNYMTQPSTSSSGGVRDVSPSSSSSTVCFPGGSMQGVGSNTGTPTHGYPVYPPGGQWHPQVAGTPDAESPLKINGPLDVRRGSEDSGYTQSLLLHQKARMDKLSHDLESGYRSLKRLEEEVSEMEKARLERKNQRSSTFPTVEDVGKLRDENRRLLIDIQLMTREIDVVNNGQTPLGVLDPEEQNFYKNIGSTGQRGSIHAGGDDGSDRNRNPQTENINRVPPARPPPPVPNTRPGVAGVTVLPNDTSHSSPDPEEAPNWSCSACTFLNHPLLDRCEFCEMPRINQATTEYR